MTCFSWQSLKSLRRAPFCKINVYKSSCFISGGNVYCKCKNDEGYYPDCKGPEICTDEYRDFCEKNDGICVSENFQATCICKDEESKGIFPECKVKEPSCESYCQGKCIYDKEKCKKVCVCLNGMNPPLCKPVCNLECGNAFCDISSGTPKCVCKERGLQPPHCNPECREKCRENEVCDFSGKCVCKHDDSRRCSPFCSKRCGKNAECLKVFSPDGEECRCLYGGIHPNCEEPGCNKNCKIDEVCVIDVKTKQETCVCRNMQSECEPCTKNCGPKGKCIFEDGKEKCVCINNADSHPHCDSPCFEKECPGGKCVLDKEGNGKCVCRHESNLPSIYPECQDPDECSKLRCEDQNGRCAYDENGKYKCICENKHHNFPLCRKYEGCFPACNDDEECAKAGDEEAKHAS